MSASDQPRPRALSEIDALLTELGIEGTPRERLRAWLLKALPTEDQSSRRARTAFPPTRVVAMPPEPGLESVAQLTLPARRAVRAPDGGASEKDASSSSSPGTTLPRGLPEAAEDGPRGERPTLVPVHLIAEGGMGEVYRARDQALGRDLAMKVLHTHLTHTSGMRGRFLDEAQITAQLAHPSIPPIHTLGELSDGRPYFSMKEVHGRTLADLIAEDAAPLPEQRRLEIFQRVCEAVAYAHARGVIHCDLKPLNVMVGAFGEVLVMDWGVARLVAPARTSIAAEPPVHTTASGATTAWEVAGTPAYMSPEQALGEADRIGPASDVYALGVMLYETLAGSRPYRGGSAQLLFLASQGEVPPLPRAEGSAVDDSLDQIITRAMAPDPANRYEDAGALGEEVARWREGAMRREKALVVVREASELLLGIAPKRRAAQALERAAEVMLAALAPEAGPAARAEAWRKSDEAVSIGHDVELELTEVEQMLEAALVHAPGLAEPRRMLADLAYERHHAAESSRAMDEAARIEIALRAHDLGKYADYLEGTARLTLATTVPAVAVLHRFVLKSRRFVLERVSELGPTPLIEAELPIGSYAIELRAEGRPRVCVPVVLRRTEDAIYARPGSKEPAPVAIPEAGEIAKDEVYVPAGRLDLDESATTDPEGSASLWVDAFVMQTFPVTARELARFLAEPAGAPFRGGVLRDGAGMFRPDWPGVGISWDGAHAYARWLSERTGLPWRLPYEIEWERAARGADGRSFPWGDVAEAAFAHLRAGGRTPSRPSPIQQFADDVSPFGVRGLAGNVRDWCADADVPPTPIEGRTPSAGFARRIVRGGSFRTPLDGARTTTRTALPASQGVPDVGFRLVRSFARS